MKKVEDYKISFTDVIDDWELDFYLGYALKCIARAYSCDTDNKFADLNRAMEYIEMKTQKMMDDEIKRSHGE